MPKTHRYTIEMEWTGNSGSGTADYRDYRRDNCIRHPGKPEIPGSSDPAYRGDAAHWNPEELLVAALAACHQLWYLHLCADAGLVVQAYRDRAEGVMEETPEGGGRFVSVVLRPQIQLAPGADLAKARALHAVAGECCFIDRRGPPPGCAGRPAYARQGWGPALPGSRLYACRGRAALRNFAAFSRRCCARHKRRDPRETAKSVNFAVRHEPQFS